MMKDADCFSVEVGHGFCFHINGRPTRYSRRRNSAYYIFEAADVIDDECCTFYSGE